MFKKVLATLSIVFLVLTINAAQYNIKDIQSKKVKVGESYIYYNELGAGDKYVVLVHGLFSSKECWNEIMPSIANAGYNIVALDLPGYGESLGYDNKAYTINSEVKYLSKFLKKLKINNLNIAGNSLGGTIVSKYYSENKDSVKTIAFIGSAAGYAPWSSDVESGFLKKNNPFIPTTVSQFNDELKMLFSNPPVVPKEQIKEKIDEYKKNKAVYENIWNIVNIEVDRFAIEHDREPIEIPCLALWGKDDGVFSINDSTLMKDAVSKNGEFIELPNSGHIPMVESPKDVLNYYLPFLKSNE